MAPPSVAVSVFLIYAAMPPLPEAVSPVLAKLASPLPGIESWLPVNAAYLPAQHEADVQLASICQLGENWDGYGGQPVHPDTAANAKSALQTFQRLGLTPDITPNSNGTISFEWSSSRGAAHVEMGRLRYVGIVRPKGLKEIPITGDSSSLLGFADPMREIAGAIMAALFPKETPPNSSNQLTAAHVRHAA